MNSFVPRLMIQNDRIELFVILTVAPTKRSLRMLLNHSASPNSITTAAGAFVAFALLDVRSSAAVALWPTIQNHATTIESATPVLIRILHPTSRISDPAPQTFAMEPRRNRGVRCIRFVRRRSHILHLAFNAPMRNQL